MEEDRPVRRERGVGGVEWDRPVAEIAQAQIGDDLRLQHRDDVGGARDPGPGPDLLGDAGAAEQRPALEDDHAEPGTGEVCGRGQPVVPAADHDRVV